MSVTIDQGNQPNLENQDIKPLDTFKSDCFLFWVEGV